MSRRPIATHIAGAALFAAAATSVSLAQINAFGAADNPVPRRGLELETFDRGFGEEVYAHGGEPATACSQTGTLLRYEVSANQWFQLPDSPLPQMYHDLVRYDDGTGPRLWAVGGATCSSRVTTVQSYDPFTNQWHPEASLLTGRGTDSGAVVMNGTLYAVTGATDNSTEYYDVASKTWKPWFPRPTTEDGSAAALGNKIYVAYSNSGITEICDSTGVWTTGPTIPGGLHDTGQLMTVNGAVYGLAGRCGENQRLYRLRDDDSHWDLVTTIPELYDNTHLGAVGLSDGRIFVTGGIVACGATTVSTDSFFLESTLAVTQVANNIVPRRGVEIEAFDRGFGTEYYLHGGEPSSPCSQTGTMLRYEPYANNWVQLTDSPLPQMYHDLVRYDDGTGSRLWAIGGATCSSREAIVQSYNPFTDQWFPQASLNTGRGTDSGAVVMNGTLYAVMGATNNSTEVYDTATGTWQYWIPRQHTEDGSAAAMGGKIYVVYSSSGITEIFDSASPTGTWGFGPTLPGGLNDTGQVFCVGGAIYGLGGRCGVDQPLYRLRANESDWDLVATFPELHDNTHLGAAGVGYSEIFVSGGIVACGSTTVSADSFLISWTDLLGDAIFRNVASDPNPAGFHAARPVLGETWTASVDNSLTGNTWAHVVGYSTPLTLYLPNLGDYLLVNIADPNGELLGFTPGNGTGELSFSGDVPSDLTLLGFTFSTQGYGFGGGPIRLHNAYDLRVGI